MIKLIYVTIVFHIPIFLAAQNTCEVKMDNIGASYEGECKKGKAHGKGEAKGVDEYIGSFVKGYPHGEGTYNWKNGNVHKGVWERGLEHGKGVLTIKRYLAQDSIVSGYWKKGVYVGKYEQPYKTGTVRNIPRNRVAKNSNSGNSVYFIIQQNGLGISANDFQVVNSGGGHYVDLGGRRRGFSDVEFPAEFRVTFSVPNSFGGNSVISEYNIEVFEKGAWEITFSM